MLEARLQTSYQGAQNGTAPYSRNAGAALQSEKQEYFTFSQAARLMGVSRQYIYKLVKEDKLRASRISGRMALVRRADIELMLKSKPYERLVAKTTSTSPSITPPKRLRKNIKSTPNGCGLTHGNIKCRR